VTHRCHNRAFLLKFARDRDTYRAMLRQQLPQFQVALLDYCLTSNHAHLLMRHLEAALAEAMAQCLVKREPIWTERLAIGSSGFVEKIKPMLLSRRETEVIQTAEGLTVPRESPVLYRPLRAGIGSQKRR
jgi:hypothetical protein